ncbi:hypothetical protein [Nocardia caishijiensis]|uniref:Uncharacterized protein n=1 Tax=Nocardia caishijiensis TaxID=184756 RepID=A0ABQ6YTG8_9NOCA|nr:hypothetical protein [Nocardia caishijiensis]KAF0848928.1 hypothetical protein FNL39_101363 [Nocardia caishijiensis]
MRRLSVVAAVVMSLGLGLAGAATAETVATPGPVATDSGSAGPLTASADPDSGSAALPGLLLRCLSTGTSLSMGMPTCV